MNRSIGLPGRIRAGIMVGLTVTLVWWLPTGSMASEASGITQGPEGVLGKQNEENSYVVVKSYYATIRSKPSDDAELIGYLPGASKLRVIQPQRKVDGWLQVRAFWWSTSDEMWVRLTDVAFASAFQRMDDKQKWPLEYSMAWPLFSSGKRGTFLVWYPPDNRCPGKPSKSSEARFLQKAGLKLAEVAGVSCIELWYLPGTYVIYASSGGGYDIGWYDRKTGDILFSSDDMLGRVIYGYRDGRVLEFMPEGCASGEEIACGTGTDAYRDPLKTIPPHPPASPYRAHPAARPHPPGSYRASPDARPHPPSHYRALPEAR